MAESLALATAYVDFVARGVETVLNAAKIATAGIVGFAAAGLAASAQMQMLTFQLGQLSRGVGAIFLPIIETATKLVGALAQWFGNLSESAQNAFQGLITGAVVAKYAIAAVGGPIGLLVAAIAALVTGTEGGQQMLSGLGDTLSKLLGLVTPVLEALQGVFEKVFAAIQPAIESMGESAQRIFKALEPAINAVVGVLESVGDAFAAVAGAWYGMLAGALSSAAGLLESLAGPIQTVSVLLSEMGEAVAELFALAAPLIDALGAAFGEFLDAARPVVEWIVEGLVASLKIMVEQLLRTVALIQVLSRHKLSDILRGKVDIVAEVEAQVQSIKDKAKERREGAKAGGPKKPGRRIGPTPGAFEDIANMFKRIQMAASDTGKKPEEETADNTKRAADATEALLDEARGKKPKAEPAPLEGQ